MDHSTSLAAARFVQADHDGFAEAMKAFPTTVSQRNDRKLSEFNPVQASSI